MKKKKKRKKFAWLLVTTDEYELPLMVCDTVRELAERCNTTEGTIYSTISHFEAGRKPRSKFKRVEI